MGSRYYIAMTIAAGVVMFSAYTLSILGDE